MTKTFSSRVLGSLYGLALGDALGSQFFVPANRPHFESITVPDGEWTWTDDTEMAASVIAVLGRYGEIEQDALARSFAEHYDFYRGYGPSAGRLLRLVGEGADWRTLAAEQFDGRGSWGNGAAMRVPPLGAYFAGDPERAAARAALSAVVTHTHPEGVAGAVAVAVAAALAPVANPGSPDEYLAAIREHVQPSLVRDGIDTARSLLHLEDPRSAAAVLGNGIEISAQDTVPFALWTAAKNIADFPAAFWSTVIAGGDMDTTCAITCGIVGTAVGYDALPSDWLKNLEPLPYWCGIEESGRAL
ncbi:ADP-ribosylglycohydrolase family protein [Nocardia huaxiensis]|uniref:ADP-ribosylglycohydrolase family protein n=1 Tax=Nocardia huaxiensis TaxID=2755382 RepID=UPI001E62C0CC|nr:ADP-ribosylglycohydrolase family protein [Nocardia huaxiensis]UFS97437.1 ADP-ribosylglycohydrolase family protein [Nocardia huaxiensis]